VDEIRRRIPAEAAGGDIAEARDDGQKAIAVTQRVFDGGHGGAGLAGNALSPCSVVPTGPPSRSASAPRSRDASTLPQPRNMAGALAAASSCAARAISANVQAISVCTTAFVGDEHRRNRAGPGQFVVELGIAHARDAERAAHAPILERFAQQGSSGSAHGHFSRWIRSVARLARFLQAADLAVSAQPRTRVRCEDSVD
jgi:hypothetical protein